jgi:hypothetical protein
VFHTLVKNTGRSLVSAPPVRPVFLLYSVRFLWFFVSAMRGEMGLGRGEALAVLTHERVSGALEEGGAGRWTGYST